MTEASFVSVFKLNSLISVLVLVFMGILPQLESSQRDPELGTWVLYPAKSTYDPGPALKSQRRTVEEAGDGQRLRNETVTADGMHALVGYTAKFDGKDYPVTGSPYGDTVVLERLDSHTVKATVKKGGTLPSGTHELFRVMGRYSRLRKWV